nr:hypothetical protein [Herbaspirillum sp. B65]
MPQDPDWQADLARYNLRRPFLKEQSIWAIWVYRWGRRIEARPAGLMRKLQNTLYWPLFRLTETAFGISYGWSSSPR